MPKSVSLAILELLAFNAQKFTGSRDSGHAPFYSLLALRGWRDSRGFIKDYLTLPTLNICCFVDGIFSVSTCGERVFHNILRLCIVDRISCDKNTQSSVASKCCLVKSSFVI